MTPADIDALPPGPELDRLIAECVMGWKYVPYEALAPYRVKEAGFYQREEGGELTRFIPYRNEGFLGCPFTPSANIADAWEVVEKLKQHERYRSCGIAIGSNSYEFGVTFCASGYTPGIKPAGEVRVPRVVTVKELAETASLAICRASLKFVMRDTHGG